ncbi:MAG TPA: hypothetical protein VKB93_20425, partial [Thermoanaerobaculia bacterium]|nr:hypothetical protein [Thermoanaerobaculia bacterium]
MTRALAALVLFTTTAFAQELPQPGGPFHVGRASFSAIDRSRPEPFTDDPADHRQLLFEVWYPTGAKSGTIAPYLDVLAADELFRRSYSFVGIEHVVATRAHGIAGAPLSSARRRYPLILFSHGLGSVAGLYSTLLENLASHGYVVAGINHPYFSAAMRLPDGRVVKNESRRPWPGADATPEQQAELIRIREAEAIVQAQDLRFALD